MAKSPDAFRTISEVADWLGVQAHVLRFWESKFNQVKPIKRAGGRRYYRPTDMLLIGGLKKLLHEDGMTIKGAQKLLREKGVSFVADLSQPLDDLTAAVIEGSATEVSEEVETDTVIPLEVPQADAPVEGEDALEVSGSAEHVEANEPEPMAEPPEDTPVDDAASIDAVPEFEAPEPAPETLPADTVAFEAPDPGSDTAPQEVAAAEGETDADAPMPTFRSRHREPTSAPDPASPTDADTASTEAPAVSSTGAPDLAEGQQPSADAEPPKPRIVEVAQVPAPEDIDVQPSALTALAGLTALTAEEAQEIKPLLARLTRLHASMSSPRKDISKD